MSIVTRGLGSACTRSYILKGMGEPCSSHQGYDRTCAENVVVSDGLGLIIHRHVPLIESGTILDTLTRKFETIQRRLESSTVSDTIARVFGAVQNRSETVSVSDMTIHKSVFMHPVPESITASDSVSGIVGYGKILLESLSISTALSGLRKIKKILSGHPYVIQFRDNIALSVGDTRSIAETVSISDMLKSARHIRIPEQVTETISDVLTASAEHTRAISESIQGSSTVRTMKRAVDVFTDSLSVSDSVIRKLGAYIRNEYTFLFRDPLLLSKGTKKTISDNESVSDTLIDYDQLARVVSESVSTSDSSTAAKHVKRRIKERLSASDIMTDMKVGAVAFLESLSISDNMTFRPFYTRIQTVSMTISDSLSVLFTTVKRIEDYFHHGITDNLTKKLDAVQNIPQTLTISTTLFLDRIIPDRTLSESVVVSDALSLASEMTRTVRTVSHIADKAVRTTVHKAVVTSSSTISDILDILRTAPLKLSETLQISDNLTNLQELTMRFTESISVSDTVRAGFDTVLRFTESLSVSDTLSYLRQVPKQIAESVPVTVSLIRAEHLDRFFKDTVQIGSNLWHRVGTKNAISRIRSFASMANTEASSSLGVSDKNRTLSKSNIKARGKANVEGV